MAGVYSPTNFGIGVDGKILLSPDNGAGTVFALEVDSGNYSISDNIGVGRVIDATMLPHVYIPGARIGTLSLSGPIDVSRIASLLTYIVGPRIGIGSSNADNLVPFLISVTPGAIFSTYSMTAAWCSQISFSASFSTAGMQNQCRYNMSFIVCDPDNRAGISALSSTGSGAGTTGLNLASFMQATFSSGISGSPTVYDGITMFSLVYDQGLIIQPALNANYAGYRLVAGASAGQPSGAVTLSQLLSNASNHNAIPSSSGTAQIAVTLNSPADAAGYQGKLQLVASTVYTGNSQRITPGGHTVNTSTYQLFGSSTDTGGWVLSSTYTPPSS